MKTSTKKKCPKHIRRWFRFDDSFFFNEKCAFKDERKFCTNFRARSFMSRQKRRRRVFSTRCSFRSSNFTERRSSFLLCTVIQWKYLPIPLRVILLTRGSQIIHEKSQGSNVTKLFSCKIAVAIEKYVIFRRIMVGMKAKISFELGN